MVAFDEPLHGVCDAGFTGDPLLAWYARNSSKPGRDPREAWVLHASPGWSRVEAAWRSGAALGAELAEARAGIASGKIRGSR